MGSNSNRNNSRNRSSSSSSSSSYNSSSDSSNDLEWWRPTAVATGVARAWQQGLW